MSKKNQELNNIATLTNEYTKEQHAEFQKQHKQLIFRRRRLALVFIIAFIVFAFSGVQVFKDYQHLSELKQEKQAVEVEGAEVDQRLTNLEQDVRLLQDEEYVAKLARSRFDLTKEGEQVYPVPEFGDATNSSTEATAATETSQSQPATSE